MHEHLLVKFADTLSVLRLFTNQFNKMRSAALCRTSQCIVNMLYVSVSGLPCFETSYNKLKISYQ